MYQQQKALRLKNGGKFSWFDCHRCSLRRNHAFRRNRTTFRKCRIVPGCPPHRIFGKELYAKLEDYPMVTTNGGFVIPIFKGNEYNQTKESIFWELPYW